jgi:subtilisin family serine protease
VVAVVATMAAGCAAGRPVVGAFPSAAPPVVHVEREDASAIEPAFHAQLGAADPSHRFTALVDLTEQLDLNALGRVVSGHHLDKETRRAAIVGALERLAERQQARLEPLLHRLLEDGSLSFVRHVAIVNRLVVEGTAGGLAELADSPEVARVLPDWTSLRAPGATHDDAGVVPEPLGETFRSWAVDAMGASRLWDEGLDGHGIVVGIIDTGVYEPHEQLRGRDLPGGRGWFDPVEGTSVPSDRHGHGTGVLSQAVGSNVAGRIVGIAPGARWCAALGNWKNFYCRSRMTLAADWMLRVGRPDVLINAWSHDEGPCSDFDRPFIDAWKASGIFVVFPAGNAGPDPRTGESPAQLAGVFPAGGPVFSVAALLASGRAAPLSSRGPSRCGSLRFPSIAGPGADLPMATPGGPRGYVRAEGTSLTAGLVGGAAALLLQAEPETEPEELERALLEGARDLEPAGPDDATGAGAVDLPAALRILRKAHALSDPALEVGGRMRGDERFR